MNHKNLTLISTDFRYGAAVDELVGNWIFSKSPRCLFDNSPHRETEDIILRGPVGYHTRDLQELHHEILCEDYPAAELFPETLAQVNDILGEQIYWGRVIISKLPFGQVIYPHTDEGPVPKHYLRYHFVVAGGDGNWFICGDESVSMSSGTVWLVDVQKVHMVSNHMERDRIHLIVDVVR